MKPRVTITCYEGIEWAHRLWTEMTGLPAVEDDVAQSGKQIAFVQMFLFFLERNYIIVDSSEEMIENYQVIWEKAADAFQDIYADLCANNPAGVSRWGLVFVEKECKPQSLESGQ